MLGVALASPGVVGDWSWLKWLPHVDVSGWKPTVSVRPGISPPGWPSCAFHGPGARRPAAVPSRSPITRSSTCCSHRRPGSRSRRHRAPGPGLTGVTVIHRSTKLPDSDQYPDRSSPSCGSPTAASSAGDSGWQPCIVRADAVPAAEAARIAPAVRWVPIPVTCGRPRPAARRSPRCSSPTPRHWTWPGCEHRVRVTKELQVPISVTAAGEPLYFDLKDEAGGGMGPHGLMIRYDGLRQSRRPDVNLLSLLTTHSADQAHRDLRGLQGRGRGRHLPQLPQVVAVISNMAEKRSLADRFADTLRGEVAGAGNCSRPAAACRAARSTRWCQYEAAIAAGHDLPPMPTVRGRRQFTLMLADHPEYTDLFITLRVKVVRSASTSCSRHRHWTWTDQKGHRQRTRRTASV